MTKVRSFGANDKLFGDGNRLYFCIDLKNRNLINHARLVFAELAGEFTIHLTVDGVDGVPANKSFSVKVTGNLKAHSNLTDNRRFVEPTDR